MPAHIVVIGAGITGASAAFALARRDAAVTIVDDGAPGQATAASAGIIAPWGSATQGPLYDVAAAAGAFYPTLLEHLAGAGVTRTDYRRTGALYVHRDPAVLDDAEHRIRPRVAAAQDVAGEVHRLSPEQARARFPVLAPDLAGVLITGGARVDGRTLRDGLLQGAQNLGARRVHGHARLAGTAGNAVAGATRETGSGFDARVTAGGQAQVLQDALGIAPGLAQATHLETRVGLRPLPDELPVAGALPGLANVYVATGYGAVGLTLGPLLGDALARSILGEPAPELASLTPPGHEPPH